MGAPLLFTAGKFLAPHLLRAAGYTAATGAVLGTADKLSGDTLLDAVGMGARSVGEGEVAAGNYDPTTGSSGRKDLGDFLRWVSTGVSAEDVDAAAKTKFTADRNKQLATANRAMDARITELGLDGKFEPMTYQDGNTTEDTQRRIDRAGAKLGLIEQIDALGGDISGFSSNTSAPALKKALADAEKAKEVAEEQRRIKLAREESLRPGGAAWTALENQKQQRINNARESHQFAERNRQLEADRELRRQENKDKMQLSMLQYQGQREDRAYRREQDRRSQQQQSIMMLMKGLTQLGAGFAI